MSVPFKVYAVLDRIPSEFRSRFDRVVDAKGSHEGRLNLLAAEIAADAKPTDTLVFLDGDAFPVADPIRAIRDALTSTTLLAVRRDENLGDKQPHPCFCAIEVQKWQGIQGDWSSGYEWTDDSGKTTSDVGGNLLGILERNQLSWTPLLRTNKRNDHPVWFGVYGDIVYHHGSGFRRPHSRADDASRPRDLRGARLPVLGDLIIRENRRRQDRWLNDVHRHGEKLSDEWFDILVHDPDFYRKLIAT